VERERTGRVVGGATQNWRKTNMQNRKLKQTKGRESGRSSLHLDLEPSREVPSEIEDIEKELAKCWPTQRVHQRGTECHAGGANGGD
jgi:hypothetical protein